jgi:hypothetical protein
LSINKSSSEIGTILVQIFHVLEMLLTPANGKPKSVKDPLIINKEIWNGALPERKIKSLVFIYL